ncbi:MULTISPECIES: hypothetical protein [unclassified Sulfurospirillum]|uniref:hypothetical protein n=1 Tax=unclassified Sulfurospirillum TaxID=2618290 RepID=UPI0005009785|nr:MULTISPECIES: hypothetical protein [unclassified Sulfurospirillum]KFL34672.1 hypothetical protein JU57_05055 [Sulfurospirillum sp. SCADC]
MSYIALRKDLTESKEKCEFCPKHMTSLKAFVLLDTKTGKEVYAGPVCAKNHIDPSIHLNHLPDFTKFTLGTEEHRGSRGGHVGSGASTPEELRKKKAREYLELREYKVIGTLVPSYKPLKDYYDILKIRDLNEGEINHIINIEARAPYELKHETLLKCYNYLFWIDVALLKVDSTGITYLKNMKTTILKYKKLSSKQLEGTNKWLEHIEGVPTLQA